MAKSVAPLTDNQIRKIKPKDKDFKIFDGAGLFLLIKKSGAKWWRLKYRYNGKEKSVSLGVYPDVTLAEARAKRKELKDALANGVDPATIARTPKQVQAQKINIETGKLSNNFKLISDRWLIKKRKELSENYIGDVEGYVRNHLLPKLGSKDIHDITRADVVDTILAIEEKGHFETARKCFNTLNAIFKHAMGIYPDLHNVTADIDRKNTFIRGKVKHYPVITDPIKLGRLLINIDHYDGSFIVVAALKLAPHVFLRPGNLLGARWCDINIENKIWRIPKEFMKTNNPHIVPLTNQTIDILKTIYPITGSNTYVFHSLYAKKRHLSDNALTAALRRMGYSNKEIVPYSFRGIIPQQIRQNKKC